MNQLFTIFTLFFWTFLISTGCSSENACREITGRWTNREGQILSFDANGTALWLIKFGSQYDSFPILYRYDCDQKPATLDFTNFPSGPLVGKTLFGIIEWSSDTVFRLDATSGTNPEARPKKVMAERSSKFYKEAK